MLKWCKWHVECREDVGQGTWTCTAHLAEGRAIVCPYENMADAKSEPYPCVDAEVEGGE